MSNFLILYSWFVRCATFFLPDIPPFQMLRGWLYSFGMKKCGGKFRVSHDVILNRIDLLDVGTNVYFSTGCVIAGGGDIRIGSNVIFGPNVVIAAANHKFDGESFVNQYAFGQVIIESNCWIGANVSVLMGTFIASSCVIGAGSVCNKLYDKPQSLYAGVPARFIKKIENEAD